MLKAIDDFVWGVPLIVLILAVGIFLTIRLRGLQITKLPLAIKHMVANEKNGEHGEVSSFGALCTALSATIGTGNIVGVATALVAGGRVHCSGCGSQHCLERRRNIPSVCLQLNTVLWQRTVISSEDRFITSKTEWVKNGNGSQKFLHFSVSEQVYLESELLRRSTGSQVP